MTIPFPQLTQQGWHKGVEAYSAFDGYITPGTAPEQCPTDLPPIQYRAMKELLRANGITHVVISGLATDYCVASTALSALSARFKVAIVNSAVQGMTAGDSTEVKDKVIALGGAVIGRKKASAINSTMDWEDELAAWLAK
jgi:nicotinamidase-related amidase